jgi:hypothetical protein
MNAPVPILVTLLIMILISTISLMVVLRLLFRGIVQEGSEAMRDSTPRALGIGLLNFLFIAAIALALFALAENLGAPFLFVPAMVLVALLSIAMTLGLVSVSSFLGEMLAPDQALWRRTAFGGLALTLGCLTPYVGWYFLLPYAAFVGLGAYVQSLYFRWRPGEEIVA